MLNKLRCFLCISLCSFVPSFTMAQDPVGNNLSEIAIMSFLRTTNKELIDTKIAEAEVGLSELSNRSTDPTVGATLIFRDGLDASQVEEFLGRYSFDLHSAELKHAVGTNGQIFTVSVGARDLQMLEGPVSEKLAKVVGRQQLTLAANASSDQRNEDLLEFVVARNPKFYRLDVAARVSSLIASRSDSRVLEIFVDDSGRMLSSFQSLQVSSPVQRVSGEASVLGRRLEDGPPPEFSAYPILDVNTIPNEAVLRQLQGLRTQE